MAAVIVMTSMLTASADSAMVEMGDVNYDGALNVSDVVAMRGIIMGNSASRLSVIKCDMTGDGELNVTDVVALRGIIMSAAITERPANQPIESGKTYALYSCVSDKAAAVRHSSEETGANVCQWEYDGTATGQWRAEAVDDTYFRLISTGTGLALSVSGEYKNGANVDQNVYSGADGQLFRFVTDDNGDYIIYPKGTDEFVLDVSSSSQDNGANIQVYGLNHSSAQKWYAVSVEPAEFELNDEFADLVMESWLDVFCTSGDSGTNSFINYRYFWDYAEMTEVILDGYDRTGDTKYLDYFNSLYNGFVNRFGEDWLWNEYNDDIMWMVIACCRAYIATGNETYMQQAKYHFDEVYSRGLSNELGGGGLYWVRGNLYTKNACINGPAVIASCYLYDMTQDSDYLSKATSLMAWEIRNLFDTSTGRVNDNIHYTDSTFNETAIDTAVYTYNQGTFIGAATMLYERTGNADYINYAKLAGDFTVNEMCGGGVMTGENSGDDGPGFKGIFARWFGYYIDSQQDYTHIDWLAENLRVGWNNRNYLNIVATRWGRKTTSELTRPFSYSTFVALAQMFPYDVYNIPKPEPEPQAFITNANELMQATEENFWLSDNGYLREDRTETSPAYVWNYGAYLESLYAACKNNPDDEVLKARYISYLDNLENYRSNHMTDSYAAAYDGSGTVFYDDNMWLVMAFYKAYDLLGDQKYLDSAESLAAFCYTGWDDVLGGGIYWSNDKNEKNTCSNAPMALASCDLYNITGKQEYLDWAIRIYAWTKENLQDPTDYLYFDHLMLDGSLNTAKYTYNTGCMLASAASLYLITEDAQYLEDAKNIGNSAEPYFFREREGVYVLSGGSREPWFHAWLVDGYLRLDEAAPGEYAENIRHLVSAVGNGWNTRDTATGLVYSDWRGRRGDIDTLRDQAGTARILYDLGEWLADNPIAE